MNILYIVRGKGMIITAIYATERTEKSTTYQLAQHVIKQLSGGDTVFEFHLPKAMPHYCSGCFRCMTADITKCAAYPALKPIIEAINASDLLIFYCTGLCVPCTGADEGPCSTTLRTRGWYIAQTR